MHIHGFFQSKPCKENTKTERKKLVGCTYYIHPKGILKDVEQKNVDLIGRLHRLNGI